MMAYDIYIYIDIWYMIYDDDDDDDDNDDIRFFIKY